MHRKQTSPIEVPRSFLPYPTLRNLSSSTDSTRQKCHGHVAPLHLLSCVKAVLNHSNLVNHLALKLAPRFLSSTMEISYLHVSLVHSASASSGLPEAAGCFPPVFTCTPNRGDGGVHTGFSEGPSEPPRRSRYPGLPAPGQRCGLPGTVLHSGC